MDSVFHKDWFFYGAIGMIVFDVIALAAFTFSSLNWILLPVVVLSTAYLAIRDLRWSYIIPLLELSWGSFGAALMWDIGGMNIPLRMVFFSVFLIIWILKLVLRKEKINYARSSAFIWFLLMLVVVVWGGIIGLTSGNSLTKIFFDGNAYLFLLYLPLWLSVFKLSDLKYVVSLLAGSAFTLSVKTILLFHVFINQYEWANIPYLYVWIRDTRIGEITPVNEIIWRIFIQSQFFIGVVIIWFIVYVFSDQFKKWSWAQWGVLGVYGAALAVALSRSFWLGIFGTAIIMSLWSFKKHIKGWRRSIRSLLFILTSLLLSSVIILISSSTSLTDRRLSDALLRRLSESTTDAAGASRLQMLPPLVLSSTEHLLQGSGFGTEVTYYSDDPTIKNRANPHGVITTYAFEWGYLDQLLKFGLLGLSLFMLVLLYQFYRGLKMMSSDPGMRVVIGGLLAGLLYTMIVHIVSPYLNHPLGLGYVMFTVIVLHHLFISKEYAKTEH